MQLQKQEVPRGLVPREPKFIWATKSEEPDQSPHSAKKGSFACFRSSRALLFSAMRDVACEISLLRGKPAGDLLIKIQPRTPLCARHPKAARPGSQTEVCQHSRHTHAMPLQVEPHRRRATNERGEGARPPRVIHCPAGLPPMNPLKRGVVSGFSQTLPTPEIPSSASA